MIVTEIVDSGLLGEMIIPTLRHAWQELLLKHEARGCVIPCAADVYVCAVQCPEIKRQSRRVCSLSTRANTCVNIAVACTVTVLAVFHLLEHLLRGVVRWMMVVTYHQLRPTQEQEVE